MPTEPSNVSNETILHHTLEAMKTKRAIDEATGAHRAGLKRAKAEGCDTSAITYAIKSKKLDIEDVHRALRNQIRVLAVINMPTTQIDLFGTLDLDPINEKAQAALLEADAFDSGYSQGKMGAPVENCPHLEGTLLAVKWRAGWNDGQAFLVRNMPEGSTPASQRRGKMRGEGKAAKLGPAPSNKRGKAGIKLVDRSASH